MTDTISKEKRHGVMAKIRGKDTKIEVKSGIGFFIKEFDIEKTVKILSESRIFQKNTKWLFSFMGVFGTDMRIANIIVCQNQM